MKAIVYDSYGPPDVLKIEEVQRPTPTDDEVLVEVHAASLNAGDWHVLRGELLHRLVGTGLLRPKQKILGDDVAGRVKAVGQNVEQFKPGDEVFGTCNYGAFAEYVCVPKTDWLAPKPANISFEAAAAIPITAITALQGLRVQGQIQPGEKVLINGASGGVGTFAVQIAKSFGAEVTGVCSTKKLDKVSSLGADRVIDYTQEDFTKSGQVYDLIFSTGGYHPLWDYMRALSTAGKYICVGGSSAQYFQALLLGSFISMLGRKKMGVVFPRPNQKDLIFLMKLVETGKVIPVIDRCYPLHETADAIRYLEKGHAFGKVIITVQQKNSPQSAPHKQMEGKV